VLPNLFPWRDTQPKRCFLRFWPLLNTPSEKRRNVFWCLCTFLHSHRVSGGCRDFWGPARTHPFLRGLLYVPGFFHLCSRVWLSWKQPFSRTKFEKLRGSPLSSFPTRRGGAACALCRPVFTVGWWILHFVFEKAFSTPPRNFFQPPPWVDFGFPPTLFGNPDHKSSLPFLGHTPAALPVSKFSPLFKGATLLPLMT